LSACLWCRRDQQNGTETVGEGGDSPVDVETVAGIGPTYADRLRDASIETTADLVGRDAAALADVTGAATSRTENWLDDLA
jgi:polyhydroxyalkanoate synthase